MTSIHVQSCDLAFAPLGGKAIQNSITLCMYRALFFAPSNVFIIRRVHFCTSCDLRASAGISYLVQLGFKMVKCRLLHFRFPPFSDRWICIVNAFHSGTRPAWHSKYRNVPIISVLCVRVPRHQCATYCDGHIQVPFISLSQHCGPTNKNKYI